MCAYTSSCTSPGARSPSQRHAVQGAVLGVQVVHIHLRVERLARDGLAQLVRGGVQRPLAVYLGPEPLAQGLQVPLGHHPLHVPELLPRLLVELARVHGPQGVAGEVAERAVGPVHVLQHAEGVVGRHDAEELLHLRLPRRGEVPHGEVAGEQRALELEAQHDVHGVRELVRVDPDEARLGLVHVPVHVTRRAALGVGEAVVELGEEGLPEPLALPDVALPEQRL
mmetsp:Transcript_13297/g.46002  ORF Transcript_13297/g.46002 Transcript_13297/m.46002 type:complete len:225 (-) Transcript_13297:1089-1763(-)